MTDGTLPSTVLDASGQPFSGSPDVVRPGTCAVIFNEGGEALLEKRADYGLWGLPGGVVEAGESVESGVIREVLEETGLRVAVKRLVGVYSDPGHYSIAVYPGGISVHYVSLLFECERLEGELRISSESTDIGYFNPRELPKEMVIAHEIRIRDALANQSTPFIR